MLRRIQSVSTQEAESDNPPVEEAAAPPFVERRRADRRGMDALRAEALQNLISRVEDRNFGGLRDAQVKRQSGPRLNPRLLLLAVAVLAGSVAAFLAVREPQSLPAPPTTETIIEVVPEARTQVLVAREPIGVGQRLTAASVGWEPWPEALVTPDYIDIAASPEAISGMEGQVARTEFVPGEPIRAQKLAPAGEGFLSTIIGSGKRAVSVMVAAESASGGFIVPGDHVDVVLTRGSPNGNVSETILQGVRVMAINGRLGTGEPAAEGEPVHPEVFGGQAIATLELSPVQGEIIINASSTGKLSLVLLASADATMAAEGTGLTANQQIRLTSPFWTN